MTENNDDLIVMQPPPEIVTTATQPIKKGYTTAGEKGHLLLFQTPEEISQKNLSSLHRSRNQSIYIHKYSSSI
jgi:hypothetical protein